MFARAAGTAPKEFKTASLMSFNHDGLEIARRRKSGRGLPLRQIFYFALAVLSFKIFLFLQMGAAAYGAKMDELSKGTTIEQTAAIAMRLDPASQWLVDGIRHGSW